MKHFKQFISQSLKRLWGYWPVQFPPQSWRLVLGFFQLVGDWTLGMLQFVLDTFSGYSMITDKKKVRNVINKPCMFLKRKPVQTTITALMVMTGRKP